MEINKIKESIKTLIELSQKNGKQIVTPFIQGIPGVGKSQIIQQIKEELGFDYVIDLRMSQHDDTDIKGIPFKDESVFKWFPPDFIPVVENKKYTGKKVILLFDELNRATQETLQSIFEVVHDYKVGGKSLIPNCFVIAAGNLGYEDNTEVTEMDAALRNRFIFFTIKKDDLDLDSWVTHFAIPKKIHEGIIGFLKKNPRFFYYTDNAEKKEGGIITPRSWEKVSDIMNNSERESLISNVINICQGTLYTACGQFAQFLTDSAKLIWSPDEFFKKKEEEIVEWFKEVDRDKVYQFLNGLSLNLITRKPKVKEIKNVMTIFNLIEDDHKVAFVKSILNDKELQPGSFLSSFIEEYEKISEENKERLNNLVLKYL